MTLTVYLDMSGSMKKHYGELEAVASMLGSLPEVAIVGSPGAPDGPYAQSEKHFGYRIEVVADYHESFDGLVWDDDGQRRLCVDNSPITEILATIEQIENDTIVIVTDGEVDDPSQCYSQMASMDQELFILQVHPTRDGGLMDVPENVTVVPFGSEWTESESKSVFKK